MASTVTSPDGRRWTVRRRWLPWKPRLKKPRLPSVRKDRFDTRPWTTAEWGLDLATMGWFGLAIVLVIAMVFFVWPIGFLLVELLLVALFAAGGIVARILLRRPWLLDAETAGEKRTWAVSGWRASEDALRGIRSAVQGGRYDAEPGDARLIDVQVAD